MAVSKNVAQFFKWAPVVLIGIVAVGLLYGDGDETEDPAAESTSQVDQQGGTECQDAPASVQAFFQRNATDKQPGAELSQGQMVRSPKSYQGHSIYYFSFAVDGGEEIATWMQTGRDPNTSMQGAVRETYADELSVLGTAGDAPVHHLSWPGAKESVECVREAVNDG